MAVLAVALAACGSDTTEAAGGLTREEFITVMVELREAERAVTENDSASLHFDSLRAEILERHGTSPDALQAWVEAAASDIAGLAATWEEISARLRRPAAPDSAPDPTTDALAPPGPLPGRMTADSMRLKLPD